ncbi:uncharacterized protein [Procambarus clarkii]|uniref:uncharacterized protein n=1 Tax=Procambarus clarkii TaxID=6728 RepID=UPI0037443775
MDTATKMKRTLVGLKGHLTRQINKCQNLSQQSTVDYFELEDLLQVAESKFAHIKQHMNLYLTELQSTSIESSELDEVIDELAQYEEDIRVKLLPYKKQIAKNKLTVTSTVRTDPEVKLPQINIPTFSGDENESWDDFWSKFVDAVDSKTNIPQTTKFTYLQGLLRKEALKVISNITLTSDGYASAVQLLQTNYDNKERTVTVLVQKLLDLPSANNSAESLQNFRLELESLLKALSLKVQIQSAEWMTKVVVKRKLPRETLDKLCTIYNTTFLTLKEITEGLHTLVERQRANQDGEKVTNSSTNSHRSSTQVDTSIKPKQTLNKSNKFTSKTTLSTGKRSGNMLACSNKDYRAAINSPRTWTTCGKPKSDVEGAALTLPKQTITTEQLRPLPTLSKPINVGQTPQPGQQCTVCHTPQPGQQCTVGHTPQTGQQCTVGHTFDITNTVTEKGVDEIHADFAMQSLWESPPADFKIMVLERKNNQTNPHLLRNIAQMHIEANLAFDSFTYFRDGLVDQQGQETGAAVKAGNSVNS